MSQPSLQIFASIVTSIVLEAAPFLLLGSLLSSLIAVFAGDKAFLRMAEKPLPVQIVLGLFAGLLLPTCECGIVPVARRLLRKGVPTGAAIPFMLAGPVVNPVSLAATWVAFQGDWRMVAWRAALVMIPAASLGWILAAAGKGTELLRPTLDVVDACGCGCGHDHGDCSGHTASLPARLFDVLRLTGREFMDMGRFLVLGSLAAALCKVLLPQQWLAPLSANLWLAVPAMLLLAVLMSICSEADAFVAASLSMFPRPALLAFLALGPMLDLKLLPAFLTVFRKRVAWLLISVPALMVYLLCMALGLAGVLE
jgi:uncharacterized membrane protein YraQ (UPF0718 family)